MAELSAESSSSSDNSSNTDSSERESDKEFCQDGRDKKSVKHKGKSYKKISARQNESSPEATAAHKGRRIYRKQQKDDSSTDSSEEEILSKKKILSSVEMKRSKDSSDEEVESKSKKSSYQHENEIRERIKGRYMKEGDREAYGHRRRHKECDDQSRENDKYNDRYTKNEHGRKDEYDTREDYIENKISKDHRKRKNEYRHHASEYSPENKYDRHKKEDDEYRHYKKEDDEYRHYKKEDDEHRREENGNNKEFDNKDEKRQKRSAENKKNRNIREWDIGKTEEALASRWNDEEQEFGKMDEGTAAMGNDQSSPKKEEVDYKLSGKLTEYTNTYNGVVILYNEPPEARKPKTKWRFYPFKGDKALTMLQLHRQSAFLLGRDRKVADIPVDHPSCSKQHAVLQFRLVPYERADGSTGKRVKPYIIDLESRNKTHVNNNPIEARRYVELKEKDVIKFGFSSRDYVLLHEKSQDVNSSEDEGENDDGVREGGKAGDKDDAGTQRPTIKKLKPLQKL